MCVRVCVCACVCVNLDSDNTHIQPQIDVDSKKDLLHDDKDSTQTEQQKPSSDANVCVYVCVYV